jgi:hypothetical protein
MTETTGVRNVRTKCSVHSNNHTYSYTLRVFGSKVVRILWTQGEGREGATKRPIMSVIVRNCRQIKEDGVDRAWKIFEMHRKFLTETLKGGDHLKGLAVDGR